MVDITPRIPEGKQIISGYGAGGFVINGERVEGSVLVLPDQSISWLVTQPSQITAEAFAEIFAHKEIELLLLGTGASMVFIGPDTRALFKTRGIALDVMDTGAACRTYNVLLSEERKVAAALIAV